MTILTDSFIPLHALLLWLRIEVVDPRFILNNKLWNKFLLGRVSIVREVLQKLVHSSVVSILCTVWQSLCSYAKMHKIFITQKSNCACCVLSLATIRSKYYFNFILTRTRSGRELFDRPLYMTCRYLLWLRQWKNKLLKSNEVIGSNDIKIKGVFLVYFAAVAAAYRMQSTWFNVFVVCCEYFRQYSARRYSGS